MTFISKAIVALVSFGALTAAHSETANNSVYIEFGGNAVGYSINYERNVDARWGTRFGLEVLRGGDSSLIGVPVLVNRYWGTDGSPHKFETGVGAVYFMGVQDSSSLFGNHDNRGDFLAGTASIGYRYLPKKEGMTFKVALTPVISSDFIVPWIGFSVGRTF